MNSNLLMETNNSGPASGVASRIRSRFLGSKAADQCVNSDFRVILYSHDTMGIGHMRRNLLIASQLKKDFPRSSLLVIAGAKEAFSFAREAGIDCLTLPSYEKRPNGTYGSRSLQISALDVISIRTQTILAVVQSFQPDLLIVDKVPSGAGGELLPSLDWLSTNSDCHCVLGLREILDTAPKVKEDWRHSQTFDVIRRHFESVWIYGDPKVYNAVSEYSFPPDVEARVRFTGYLNTRSRLSDEGEQSTDHGPPFVLCTLGGGQDGRALPVNFVEAIRATKLPSLLLTGPHMPADVRRHIEGLAANISELRVIKFVEEGDLLVKNASRVVSMGGYNTLCAILTYRKPALIVPRVAPRQEQLIRARRLAELGCVDTLHPDEASSSAIAEWLMAPVDAKRRAAEAIDMNGLSCISQSVREKFPHIQAEFNGSHVHAK